MPRAYVIEFKNQNSLNFKYVYLPILGKATELNSVYIFIL